jgi:hypothetical protein
LIIRERHGLPLLRGSDCLDGIDSCHPDHGHPFRRGFADQAARGGVLAKAPVSIAVGAGREMEPLQTALVRACSSDFGQSGGRQYGGWIRTTRIRTRSSRRTFAYQDLNCGDGDKTIGAALTLPPSFQEGWNLPHE